jgi:Ca2+-binding EF-hand superfamily protein
MQGAFYKHDTDRSDRLDAREVKAVLAECGFNLSDVTVEALMKKCAGATWNRSVDCSLKQTATFFVLTIPTHTQGESSHYL